MVKRFIINRFKNKHSVLLILGTILMFILIFFLIKNEFFYKAIQYFDRYLDYYISTYLNGNINNLIIDNRYLLYIESDVQNIFSSLYIYVASFGSAIFKLYTFLIPILIFYKINKILFNELYNKYCIPQITRSSLKKYINKTLIVEIIHSIVIILIPKLVYLIILSVFFPTGISYNHVIIDALYISEPFLYTAYIYNPIALIALDVLLTIIYAMIVSFISIFITCFFKNKSLSYLIFITTFLVISFIMYIFNIVPFIFYTSIYSYFSFGFSSSLLECFGLAITQFIIWLIVAKITFKRKIKKILWQFYLKNIYWIKNLLYGLLLFAL